MEADNEIILCLPRLTVVMTYLRGEATLDHDHQRHQAAG